MRNIREGILTNLWKDFKFMGFDNKVEVVMTKESFEENYGKFEYAVYPDLESPRPYALWTEKYVVLILHEHDKLGIASITRNPSEFMFG